MNLKRAFGTGPLMAFLVATGCRPQTDAPKTNALLEKPGSTKPAEPLGHTHGTGPNGGVVFDLGKYHAEFTVDHPKAECTILIVTGDSADAEPLPIAAKEFTLTTNETKTEEGRVVAPMTIQMLPVDEKDGKASKFVGADQGIGNVADFEGTVLGEISGKPSKGEFKE